MIFIVLIPILLYLKYICVYTPWWLRELAFLFLSYDEIYVTGFLVPKTVNQCIIFFSVIQTGHILQGVHLKNGPILIRVIYLLRFTTCYITQLTCIYSKCWKWCPSISMYLPLVLTLTSADYDSCPKVNLFHGIF